MQAIVGFVDKYRLTNSLDPSDFGDDKRIRTAVEDIINTILGDV